jgi:hypothetical protein
LEESLLVKEQRHWKENFARIKRIMKASNRRFANVNEVLDEALDLLEAKLNAEKVEGAKSAKV